MTPAQEILRLIETVDPADFAKLDEIDLQVHLYIDTKKPTSAGASAQGFFGPPEYTRSRDALKAIRPEGWYFGVRHAPLYLAEINFDCKASSKQKHIYGPTLPTEELAELHAIIQAIEFERKTNE